jgi:tetratricopeptide (TPR) repeat protein/glycosyltransferase involved in cell wall biosynthesis
MSVGTARVQTRHQTLFAESVAQHLAGNAKQAITLYRKCVAADPTNPEAWNNLAALLAQSGEDDEAERMFQRAITLRPAYGEAHNNFGILRAGRQDHAVALAAFERAVALDGTRSPWLNNLGNAQVECGRFAEALVSYDRAIAIDPDNAELWSNRSITLRFLRRPDDAIASLEHAIALQPDYVNALCNLGIILKEQMEFAAAIVAFERATSIEPGNAALWANFAAVYERMGERDRMRELAQRGVDVDPQHPEAYNLLGNCHMEAGSFREALALYEQVVALDPPNRNANWNLALIWLLHGDFARGWKQFEWRKRLQSVLVDCAEYDGEEWDGSPLDGRDILVHSEQGMGDAIQFVRYAALLKKQGAGRVVLECPYPIVPLLSGVDGVDAVIARGLTIPPYHVHASLMSLPGLLGTTLDNVPADVPYIPVEPRTIQSLVSAPAGTLKVGIVWAGNPIHTRDFLRSVPLSQFRQLLGVPGTRFFSLQKGSAAEAQLAELPNELVTDLAPHLEDFRDTAAAIQSLDLVITVDTSVAHLAGALGRPTWLLLTHVPDFRWMLEREDSPWYPSMRLFRQPEPRDWASVFAQVEEALRLRVAEPQTVVRPSERSAAETIVNLASATRVPDGRHRFDLWSPLGRLAAPEWFAEYEEELVGGGHDLATRLCLDDMLQGTDALIDIAPRLGLTTLSAATAPTPPGCICVVEDDETNADRLLQIVRKRAPRVVVTVAPTPHAALREAPRAEGGRLFVRVGDETVADAIVDAVDRLSLGERPDVLLWPAIVPGNHSDALRCLEGLGYVNATLSVIDGEASMDAISDAGSRQTVISLTHDALLDIEERMATRPMGILAPATVALSIGGAHLATGLPTVERAVVTGSELGPRQIGIDWELRSDTGWGVYGMNLALELSCRGSERPAIFAADTTDISPMARHRLDGALREGATRAEAMRRMPEAPVAFDGVMLRAMGNNFGAGALWDRVTARRNAGVVFFEDTIFDAGALTRARSLDVIVTGSHWNENVLRERGLTQVATVLQGIDPTVFHPAPRSGQFADRFVVFSGGKLEYRKGQDLVVAAFRGFRARHPEALLVVAWHNNWPSLISDLDLAGHVRGVPRLEGSTLAITEWLAANGIPAEAVLDVGRVPNALMGQIVREADVALFPNRCEGGTNLVAMECMAAGVPTIVSSNTGHLDLAATGGCITLEQQRAPRRPSRFFRGIDGWGESDVEEMVEGLELAFHDRSLVASIAARGVASMAELSWRHQTAKLVDVLQPLF